MKKNLLYILSLGFILVFASCKKDKEDPGGITVKEDIIETASRQVKDDIISFTQDNGADGLIGLADVLEANSDPIAARMASSEDYKKIGQIYKRKAQAFRNIFVPAGSAQFRTTAGEDQFDFSGNAGTYTFVRASSTWNYDGGVTDKVILLFPSDTNSSTNDATLTISQYTETAIVDGMETTYMPTLIEADLSISGTTYVEVNFTASYNSSGIPTALSYNLYVKPFTSTLTYTDGANSVDIEATVAKDGDGDILSNGATITFYDASQDSVTYIDGYTQYRRIKLSGTIDLAAIDADNYANGSVSIATYNSAVDIDIIDNNNSQVVGHIEFYDNAGEVDVMVRFPDNTTKLASVYFDPILDELETFSTSIE